MVQGGVRRVLVVGAVVLLEVLGARTAPAQDTGAVETRVLQYWSKRQAKDLASAWTFYCPEYRTRVPQPQFMQMTRLLRFELRDIKVVQVQLNGSKAEVTISYRFSLPTMAGRDLDGQAKDTWSRDADGQWCKDDEPLVLPFPPDAGGPSPAPTTAPGTPGATPPSPSAPLPVPPGPPPAPPGPAPSTPSPG